MARFQAVLMRKGGLRSVVCSQKVNKLTIAYTDLGVLLELRPSAGLGPALPRAKDPRGCGSG